MSLDSEEPNEEFTDLETYLTIFLRQYTEIDEFLDSDKAKNHVRKFIIEKVGQELYKELYEMFLSEPDKEEGE